MKTLKLNKNRGWRGLAEAVYTNEEGKELRNIFSFSGDVWDDLINYHMLVIQDKEYYYVLRFEDTLGLPSPSQQRSVLIKNFSAKVTHMNRYPKDRWTDASGDDWRAILDFKHNKNNHTTSDWNNIGIRVIPEI